MIKEGPSSLDLALAFTHLASGRHAFLPHKKKMARASASIAIITASSDPKRVL